MIDTNAATSSTQAAVPSPVAKLKTPVIVLDSWGNYIVYPATIELARRLLNEKMTEMTADQVPGLAVLAMQKAFKESPFDLSAPYVVASGFVRKALRDLATREVGEQSNPMYRMVTPVPEKNLTVPLTKAWRDEFVLWAFDNKVAPTEMAESELNRTHPEKTLSCMAGLLHRAAGHAVHYVADAELEEAAELKVLLDGTWKETARIENVVQRYLTVLNAYSHRDEKYHVGEMQSLAD